MKTIYKALPIVFSLFLVTIVIGSGEKIFAQSKVDFAVEIADGFFDIGKLSPGNTEKSTLTVQNVGRIDFNYKTDIELVSGSKLMFNTIDVVVSDKQGVIFKGKLSDLEDIGERFLRQDTNENLFFTFALPEEAGNEFQGLSSKVDLKVTARGSIDEQIPGDSGDQVNPQDLNSGAVNGQKLPATSTNTFNFIIAGLVLIVAAGVLFYLQRRKKYDLRG